MNIAFEEKKIDRNKLQIQLMNLESEKDIYLKLDRRFIRVFFAKTHPNVEEFN